MRCSVKSSDEIAAANVSGNQDILLDDLSSFANNGEQGIRVRWESTEPTNHPIAPLSEPKKITWDNVGPQITNVKLVGELGGVTTLVVTFRDADLERNVPGKLVFDARNYSVKQLDVTNAPERIDSGRAIQVDQNVVRLPLQSLVTGHYELTVLGKSRTVTNAGTTETIEPVKDTAGNYLGGKGPEGTDLKFTFSSFPEPDSKTGQHVPFPEYVKRPERKKEELFNPGDKVETRVARLYYIRDAHRVAQIINRNVQSYNRAAVKMAERIAEDSRNTANEKTDGRRAKERAAIRAAEETRVAESKLQALRSELEQSRAVLAQSIQGEKSRDASIRDFDKLTEAKTASPEAKALDRDIDKAKADVAAADKKLAETNQALANEQNKPAKDQNTAELDRLTREKARWELEKNKALSRQDTLEAQKVRLGASRDVLVQEKEFLNGQRTLAQQNIRDIAAKVAQQEEVVAQKRAAEKTAQEQMDVSQAAEDRARENQFRAEVAAATTDPDTYVAGDVKSEDPVTQVSVSVIGEGVLQLRGPIRGINKIRTMINQIDAPLGQVKVGIFTVQVNGEHGDRMEKVATRIEGHIDLSRFLTNQSLGYLRRAIQEVAGAVVANVDAQFPSQYRQIDRDRKYLYAFFGRDFIDELYEMDSEFLHTENKLLSLHGMDTVSQSQACFIMALSKNDIRQQILDRFRCLVECDLPQAEWDYRKTSSLLPCKLNSQKEVFRNACEKYKFRNVHGFFEAMVYGPDTMTPMQREFIRLAQIFKSQMVAEVELKQRVIERALIEDPANDDLQRENVLDPSRQLALSKIDEAYKTYVTAPDEINKIRTEVLKIRDEVQKHYVLAEQKNDLVKHVAATNIRERQNAISELQKPQDRIQHNVPPTLASMVREIDDSVRKDVPKSKLLRPITKQRITRAWNDALTKNDFSKADVIVSEIRKDAEFGMKMFDIAFRFLKVLEDPKSPQSKIKAAWDELEDEWETYETGDPEYLKELARICGQGFDFFIEPERKIQRSEVIAKRVRRDIDHRKILEFLIDEQEEKYIELVEGTRSHIAQIDNYLKRLAIALEDDFKVQFCDPAFAGVRAASREWDVNLGQVERTTILTNNRQFAKVEPQATMEFDLPKRAPMIVEGMNGARALVQEYGTLLQDPTFLSLAGMMSGAPAASGITGGPNPGLRNAAVRNVLPGQSTDTGEQLMAQSGGPDRKFGTALEGLIPDPAVYKFETGTGFEIRPVIQPDGHSIIYDFDYMYTTNVREPVRPDEKHLGRVKRHFIHTQVQTSSFELREISRYQVALKASRTSRGVPLLEDIPGAGVLFRPLPSDESSLQQNIILGQSTVYPTLFDLMGLRWSKYVVDLDHINLRDLEHVTRGREQAIHDFTFDEASKRVDEFLDIQGKRDQHLRPDLYHQQRIPSPNHPGGYQYQPNPQATDPRNRNFTIPDRRPEEYRNPAYDPLRRNPVDEELRQIPTQGGRPEEIDLRLQPPEYVPTRQAPGRAIEEIPVPPSPASGPGAQKKTKPQTNVIQPANYEQTTVRPAAQMETSGKPRASSVPEGPKSPTVAPKKSWLKKVIPSKTNNPK